MYVVKKMQTNKFQLHPIVTNRQLFLLNGAKPSTQLSKDTTDCASDPVPYGSKKTQLLGLAQDMAIAAFNKRESDGQSDSLKPQNPRDL
jgi:hypothetical protein